ISRTAHSFTAAGDPGPDFQIRLPRIEDNAVRDGPAPLSRTAFVAVSADQRSLAAVGLVIVPLQALQRDPEYDLARPRRPAHALLGRLEPLEEAAAPQHHVAEPGPEVAQRQRHAVACLGRSAVGPSGGKAAAVGARSQEAVPVLRHARPHLREFEILAQT